MAGLAACLQSVGVPCRVVKIERPSADVAVLDLRLPMNENMRFMAGQYVDFLLKDGKRRSYSIACKPSAEGVSHLELHIRHVPGGLFTDRLFGGEVKERGRRHVRAPGVLDAHLRAEMQAEVACAAAGREAAELRAGLPVHHSFSAQVVKCLERFGTARAVVGVLRCG